MEYNEHTYKFYEKISSDKENIVLKIEVDESKDEKVKIKDIVKKYRGRSMYASGRHFKGNGYGYMNNGSEVVPAWESSDNNPVYSTVYQDNSCGFYVKKDKNDIQPGQNVYQYLFCGVDCRRVLCDILFCFFYKKPETGEKLIQDKIKKIVIGGVTYENIEYVGFVTDNDHRVVFSAMTVKDSEKRPVKMCVPIALNSKESNLSKYSEKYLYCLEEKAVNIDFYKTYDLLDGTEIDLFFGINGDNRGIYYYFNNELTPWYEYDTHQKKVHYTDIRKKFNNMTTPSNSTDNSSCTDIENWQPDELTTSDLTTLQIENYKKFEEEVSQYIWNNIVFKQEFVEGTSQWEKKPNSKNVYQHTIKEQEIFFEIALKKIDDKKSDYEVALAERYKLHIDNFYITLSSDKKCWLVGNEEFNIQNKEIFEGPYQEHEGVKNLLTILQTIPNPQSAVLSDMVAYVDMHQVKFAQYIGKLKEILQNSKLLGYLVENSVGVTVADKNNIRNKLYQKPMVADEKVVDAVYEAIKISEENGKIPNFVFLGEPGSGKTTIAGAIAKIFGYGDKPLLHKSASDLKAAYLGHTGARVFEMVKDASVNRKVIFIDEAYDLQEDDFGKEAMDILLPILSGDRKSIERPPIGNETKPQKFEFNEKNKVPPIWFAGYELEMRQMLSKNPGLYGRVEVITLDSPGVAQLYNHLTERSQGKYDYLNKKFENNKKLIKDYFGWASGREMVGYFRGYAGVDKFLDKCKAWIGECDDENAVQNAIIKIIDGRKTEMKKQYKAVLRGKEKEEDKIRFEVQKDIEIDLSAVKGNEAVVEKFRGIVDMIVRKQHYINIGIKLPKGALLIGPPGTGKTMLARAVAGEIRKKYGGKDIKTAFIAVAATELDHPIKIRKLFMEAEEYDSCVIFIDEIDAIGKHRNAPGACPARLIQLMKEMDGFEERNNIFVIAATNVPDSLDPALKRPGRFDRIIEVTYPDKQGRKEILESALSKLQIFKDNNGATKIAEEMAKKTYGYAPANLNNLVNEAAILYEESENDESVPPHRSSLYGKDSNDQEIILPIGDKFLADIKEVLERLKVGEMKEAGKEDEFNLKENKGCSATAIHEVGHALVSLLLDNGIPFESITILPRGNSLGYVTPNAQELWTKKDYLNEIRICLGGRVAEELFYGENISVGASQDLQQATQCAEAMVALFGMNETIGPMALKTPTTGYLGDTSKYRCSDSFRREVDEAIRRLLLEQMSITRNMLESKKKEIETLARFIFERETATGKEFEDEYEKIVKGNDTSSDLSQNVVDGVVAE